MKSAEIISFDTEFVSEHSYYPQLCLIQVALGDDLFVIDTCELADVDEFWRQLVAGDHETIVHAGREEYRFALRSVGRGPCPWFDVQLAAGMIGMEYPSSYGKLTQRLLDVSIFKGETRTDWRRRPLSPAQLDYALQDVIHLKTMRDKLQQRLVKLARVEWFDDESRVWQEELTNAETRPRWRRVSGISGLSPVSLAVVRELWKWRDGEAQRRDVPAKRVLRDDLIVELARRRSAEVNKIKAIRGLDRRDLKSHYEELAEAISVAIDSPEQRLPRKKDSDLSPHLNQIVQLLNAALGSICRTHAISPSIVGTSQDLRDLIAFELENHAGNPPPRLASGWRAEVVGKKVQQLLAGTSAIRIRDPFSKDPLSIEDIGETK
jgi:ribonuclease D